MHIYILAELGVDLLCELASHQILTLLEVLCQDVLSDLSYEYLSCSASQ